MPALQSGGRRRGGPQGAGRAGQGGPASPPSSGGWRPAAGAGAGRCWLCGRRAAASGGGGGRHPVRQGAARGVRDRGGGGGWPGPGSPEVRSLRECFTICCCR